MATSDMFGGVEIVPAERVPALLPMGECIEALERGYRDVVNDRALQPLRTVLQLPGGESSFLVMPAATEEPRALGAKLLTLFPRNHERGLESHQGVLVLFDPDDGSLRALVDAAPVTAIRTAASSGLATRLLAREDADDLAILGSGVQAGSHLDAMLEVRPIRRVRVWSPTPEHRERFAREAAERRSLEVETVDSAREAVAGAAVVCAVTASPTPVVEADWLADGAHVNAVGASTPGTRELDTETIRRARLYVDRRESALAEAGDVLIPMGEGLVDEGHIVGELGEVLEGRVPGRGEDGELTVFKSLGMAVQDLAAGDVILRRLGTATG